jgi:hypothetical protein
MTRGREWNDGMKTRTREQLTLHGENAATWVISRRLGEPGHRDTETRKEDESDGQCMYG